MVMDRTILHVDMNNFYASVECVLNPAIRDYPVIVCGDETLRHGIVLAKNMAAKKMGIITGETIWQAKSKCPDLVCVKAQFSNYMRFAKLARDIYSRYTHQIESFGLDEVWMDITGDDGECTANDLRERIKRELGLTVSVGVSYNKIFAKLGSDMKKPDATTMISKENYKQKVWGLPAGDLLYVGRKTAQKLFMRSIHTIGDIANTDPKLLHTYLGKMGLVLHSFANGLDSSPVKAFDELRQVKSVGNSTTSYRDLNNLEDIKIVTYILSESVAARLKEQNLKGRVVSISIRDNDLKWFTRQIKINQYTNLASEISAVALQLFLANYKWEKPVRSLGITVSDLSDCAMEQLSLFDDTEKKKAEALEAAVEGIRRQFGNASIVRGIVLQDDGFKSIHPKGSFLSQ